MPSHETAPQFKSIIRVLDEFLENLTVFLCNCEPKVLLDAVSSARGEYEKRSYSRLRLADFTKIAEDFAIPEIVGDPYCRIGLIKNFISIGGEEKSSAKTCLLHQLSLLPSGYKPLAHDEFHQLMILNSSELVKRFIDIIDYKINDHQRQCLETQLKNERLEQEYKKKLEELKGICYFDDEQKARQHALEHKDIASFWMIPNSNNNNSNVGKSAVKWVTPHGKSHVLPSHPQLLTLLQSRKYQNDDPDPQDIIRLKKEMSKALDAYLAHVKLIQVNTLDSNSNLSNAFVVEGCPKTHPNAMKLSWVNGLNQVLPLNETEYPHAYQAMRAIKAWDELDAETLRPLKSLLIDVVIKNPVSKQAQDIIENMLNARQGTSDNAIKKEPFFMKEHFPPISQHSKAVVQNMLEKRVGHSAKNNIPSSKPLNPQDYAGVADNYGGFFVKGFKLNRNPQPTVPTPPVHQ